MGNELCEITSDFDRVTVHCKIIMNHSKHRLETGWLCWWLDRIFNPFTPESDQCQISPPAPPEILHHTVRRTWLFIAYADEKWLYYKFSLRHSYNRFWKVGRIHFLSSGVKGLRHSLWMGSGPGPLTLVTTLTKTSAKGNHVLVENSLALYMQGNKWLWYWFTDGPWWAESILRHSKPYLFRFSPM